MDINEARRISKELAEEGGAPEGLLKAKCRWEQRSRLAILMEYGDPRQWFDYEAERLRLDAERLIAAKARGEGATCYIVGCRLNAPHNHADGGPAKTEPQGGGE